MRRALLALVLAAAAALGGCGLGPGEEQKGGAELRVTRDFGEKLLAQAHVAKMRKDETVMQLLRSKEKVDTRYSGGFVQSLHGLSGHGASGNRDWFYFVNGVEASQGAADYELSPGDVVQWDYRRWDAAMRVPAIVGAFPEPFVHGLQGKRLPSRVECEDTGSAACQEAKQRLSKAGVPVTGAPLGAPGTEKLVRVVVARWARAQDVQAAKPIQRGPQASGVFARVAGGRLQLLDPSGRPARTAPPGSGLVAATSLPDQSIVWLVTGLDNAGVERAAQALDARVLKDRFAVAATPGGVVALPVDTGPGG